MAESSASASSSKADIERWSPLYTSTERLFDSPLLLTAEVVHGFKRGSKELGIPTANLSMEQLGEESAAIETGIYFGWAELKGQIYPTVVSIGWNPFYKNEKKTIEAHLLAPLEDFYGEHIKVLLLGYLRQEADFKGLEELISCIHTDILKTELYLASSSCSKYSNIESWALK